MKSTSRERKAQRNAQILKLRAEGASFPAIAELVGLSDERVRQIVADNDPDAPARSGLRNTPTGRFYPMLRSLPADIALWLVQQVPPGGTIVDTVGAIITDQYFEENESE